MRTRITPIAETFHAVILDQILGLILDKKQTCGVYAILLYVFLRIKQVQVENYSKILGVCGPQPGICRLEKDSILEHLLQ